MQLDSTFSDIESSHTKGYLSRDMAALHKEAGRIRLALFFFSRRACVFLSAGADGTIGIRRHSV